MDPAATVVVQAHPLEQSYSAALRQRVVEVATTVDARPPRVFRLGQGEVPGPGDVATARHLILVYPTWSGGLPALLLGWCHQMLDEPHSLAAVQRLTAVTSCGSSLLINTIQGEWGRRYLRTNVLEHCAPAARFHWVPLYKIDRLDEAATTAHLHRLDRRLG